MEESEIISPPLTSVAGIIGSDERIVRPREFSINEQCANIECVCGNSIEVFNNLPAYCECGRRYELVTSLYVEWDTNRDELDPGEE